MQLSTVNLLLREFETEDWKAIFSYQIQPDYLGYYPWCRRTAENTRKFVNDFILEAKKEPRSQFQLAIVLKEDKYVIGTCGIRIADLECRSGEFGCELNPQYWRQGFATEVSQIMLAFGFKELHLHRIWSQCIAENTAISRVLKKIGMQQEGCLREHAWMQYRWWDVNIYGILQHEWTP